MFKARKVYLLVAVSAVMGLAGVWHDQLAPSAPQAPRLGALNGTPPLQLAPEEVLSFGDTTRLHLGDNRYMFGPGARVSRPDRAATTSPMVLGLGSQLVDAPGVQLDTAIGVGRLLHHDNTAWGESLTHLSGRLTQSLGDSVDMHADVLSLDGTTLKHREWGLSLRYRVSERANWQIQHREVRSNGDTVGDQHVTEMAYEIRF
ncbi:MAG: hypothetical protein AAGA11_11605 [Pseudomonadota bacterium]